MQLDRLKNLAEKAIEDAKHSKIVTEETAFIRLNNPREAEGATVNLGGLIGKVISSEICVFNARDVLAWIETKKA